ncbi:hypothetical protein EIP91_007993 [Steccherinum ochraceum]|uniref:RNI-like protein n=1 Tax=Steccherinum ochraceum TaxID=92696 RepID=A0A4R0RHE2_9APHY|nr:hypothetical protein EIP91_007993 [Steccherinum ochraceum]
MSRSGAMQINSLAARKRVELTGRGLSSVDGAEFVIKAISERRSVTHLVLGHNPLGDDGCEKLFEWLDSEAGRKYHIEVIHLNVCNIGDRGLVAIGQFLDGNAGTKELWLQANHFKGDPDAVASFAKGINTSRLEVLSLSTTSPPVIVSLVKVLDTPYLRELQCCMCAITPEDAPALISYIVSPRCRLHNLKANANSMGWRAIKDLVAAIERANFTLLSLDLYMNGSTEDDTADDTNAKDTTRQLIGNLLTRNMLLMRATESEAVLLLRHSRPLLLRPSVPLNSPAPSEGHCGFADLPTEIQLHALSFLAPTLSSRQLVQIYNYASSTATLPALLPSLKKTCLPDPMSLSFAHSSGCANGKCMRSSVLCNLGEERRTWLARVGCNRYDPEFTLQDRKDDGQESRSCSIPLV